MLDRKSLVIGISQSGETLDTLAAVRYARAQSSLLLAITNVVDSALAREADAVLYTRAGPEIGVAATKTFTTQLVALQLVGLHLARVRGSIDEGTVVNLVKGVKQLPILVEQTLQKAAEVQKVAAEFADTRDVFFLGRSGDFPVAMEGALKLKEIAYVRAEGYAAGEMKHGPIALIDAEVLVVGVATDSRVQSEDAFQHAGDEGSGRQDRDRGGGRHEAEMPEVADHILSVPASPDLIWTVTAVVPLQLLAYHIATARGLDVDKPRNLAKTVTVE